MDVDAITLHDKVYSESQNAVVEEVTALLDTDGPLTVNLVGPLGWASQRSSPRSR